MAAALVAAAGIAAAQQPTPTAQALQRGLAAFQAGRQEIAVPALSEAAATGDTSARFVAEFYLARIYSESVGAPAADRIKAFMLFRKLADENLNVEPNVSQRAPFVAKALIALAGFMRAGVPEIGLAPNARRAFDCLHHAATFFGDKDAQFELARTYLNEGAGDDIKRALHHLSVLAEESHPAAQAMLADLLWRGRHVKKDGRRALALVTMAVQHAPAHERMWIEESHADIFCAAPQAMRQEAVDIVARWRKTFARPAPEPAGASSARELLTERRCANGETVVVGNRKAEADAPSSKLEHALGSTAVFSFPATGSADPAARK